MTNVQNTPTNNLAARLFVGSCLALATLASCTDKAPVITSNVAIVKDLNWKFDTLNPVFVDEFDYTGKPNGSKWGYDIGGGGWGNNELEYYTPGDNADVADGKLTITAKKEINNGAAYTSSRLVTKGKGDFLYGRFESRIKMPGGRGTWAAFWMLPTDYTYGDWPKSGEIDVVENVGYAPTEAVFSSHCLAYYFKLNNQKTAKKVIPTITSDFHVYRVDWTPYSIKGYVDGQQYFTYTNDNTGSTTWPFDKRFHMLLNLAIGGDWGGAVKVNGDQGVDNTIFPATMQVDYVRVYPMIPQ